MIVPLSRGLAVAVPGAQPPFPRNNAIGVIRLKLQSFAIKMSESEARAATEKKLGLIGRLIVGKDVPRQMKLIFIENKLITYEITNLLPPLMRLLKKKKDPVKSKIRMIANGSTAGVAYYDGEGAEILELEADEEQVQHSDYPEDALITRGNALARRILRRRVGGAVAIEPLTVESVFRPYYVTFYGQLTQGQKVRYLTVAADRCSVRRTF